MKKPNKSAGVQYKLIFYYALFALLPMFLIAVFTYSDTKRIQLERLYEELSYQMEYTSKNLDEKTNSYYAVSNMFYMDNTLQSYLTADYSSRGYEDLYAYVDDLFTNARTFYPDITRISVYTSNITLPQDEYYFYLLDPENLPDWYQATGNGGIMHMQNNGDGSISFTRKLNFYESGQYQIFVRLEISEDYLNQMLGLGDEEITMVLLNADGKIQASNQPNLVGKKMDSLDLKKQLLMKNKTAYCGELQMFTDSRRYDKEAGMAASRVFLVFFVSSVLALSAIYLYSRSFRKKVDKVRQGAKSIGEGRLDYRIPIRESEKGRDELDEIAESVNHMGEQINHLIEESYKKELERKISELNLLQEQINPHFLYNALSSISVLAMGNGDKDTSRAIVYLSDFYRITLNKGKQDITIREELKLLESYLKIQRMRFGDYIEVEYDLDESLLDMRVVKLTLQPIVENAIHHGRTDDSEVFHILIRLFEDQGKTVFEVIDDGCGMDQEKLMELQNSMNQSEGGYGLRNVNIRIKLQYGPQYGVYIESERGFGTKIRIEFPGKGADT